MALGRERVALYRLVLAGIRTAERYELEEEGVEGGNRELGDEGDYLAVPDEAEDAHVHTARTST
jgi:hypothetical protein